MVSEEGLAVSLPDNGLVLRALQTQKKLQLFMFQPESTQNEGKLPEKTEWILLTTPGMWGVLSQLSYQKKKV